MMKNIKKGVSLGCNNSRQSCGNSIPNYSLIQIKAGNLVKVQLPQSMFPHTRVVAVTGLFFIIFNLFQMQQPEKKVLFQHKVMLDERISYHQQHFPNSQLSKKQMLASITELLELDQEIGIDAIAIELQLCIIDIAYRLKDDTLQAHEQAKLITRMEVLQRVSTAFHWLAAYGCRL